LTIPSCSSGPPTIIEPFHPTFYHVIGDTFTLKCSAVNDGDSPNNVAFIWFKDANVLNHTTRTALGISISNYSLFIQNLDPRRHSGKYFCGAYNNRITDSEFTNTTLTVESKSQLWLT